MPDSPITEDDRKCGARTAEEFASMPDLDRLRLALRRYYEMDSPCEEWASAGFPNEEGVQCGEYYESDHHAPCLPCSLTWGAA